MQLKRTRSRLESHRWLVIREIDKREDEKQEAVGKEEPIAWANDVACDDEPESVDRPSRRSPSGTHSARLREQRDRCT